MSKQSTTMDERMSKHETEFANRFSSTMTQLADEGIELLLPIVVIEHIHKAENNSNRASTSRSTRQESTPDLRQRGLVGEDKSDRPQTSTQKDNQEHIRISTPSNQSHGPAGEYIHSDLNVLLQSSTSQGLRSVLINEDTLSNRRIIITDDFNDKKNVFERLGKSIITPEISYSDVSKLKNQLTQSKASVKVTNQGDSRQQQDKQVYNTDKRTNNQQTKSPYDQPKTSHSEKYLEKNYDRKKQQNSQQQNSQQQNSQQQNTNDYHGNQREGHHQDRQQKSSLYSNRHSYDREPERYGREEMVKDAHKRETSRENRNSHNQDHGISSKFYNNWQAQNNRQSSGYNNNKRSHNQERTEIAKRPHVESQSSNNRPALPQMKSTYDVSKVSELEKQKTKSSLVITNKQSTTPLDLNSVRRPLSPVHNIDPKKLNINKKNQLPKTNNHIRQVFKLPNPSERQNKQTTTNKSTPGPRKPAGWGIIHKSRQVPKYTQDNTPGQ